MSDQPIENEAMGCPARVIVVTLVYPPDNYTGAARPHRFCKYLMELGYRVEILAGCESRQAASAGCLHRVHAQLDNRPKDFWEKVLRRLVFPQDEGVSWIREAVAFARRWRNEPAVIVSTAPPFTVHLAALLMKKRFGWKWIADFRDPLAGNPYRLPGRKKFDGWLEKAIFANADAVIANTDAVAEMWRRNHPGAASRIHEIWNGFDPDEDLAPVPIPVRERKVLRHVGSVYGDRYPEMLINSIERLVAAGKIDPDRFRLELIGPNGQPRESMPAAPWFHCVPELVPKDEATRLITETDYLLLLDVTQSNKGLQVPAKIFEYVRIGRPILACTLRGSPVDRILARAGIPYVGLYAGDPEQEVDRKVERFLEMPNSAGTPSQWFRETFDGRLQVRKLASIIDKAAGAPA